MVWLIGYPSLKMKNGKIDKVQRIKIKVQRSEIDSWSDLNDQMASCKTFSLSPFLLILIFFFLHEMTFFLTKNKKSRLHEVKTS